MTIGCGRPGLPGPASTAVTGWRWILSGTGSSGEKRVRPARRGAGGQRVRRVALGDRGERPRRAPAPARPVHWRLVDNCAAGGVLESVAALALLAPAGRVEHRGEGPAVREHAALAAASPGEGLLLRSSGPGPRGGSTRTRASCWGGPSAGRRRNTQELENLPAGRALAPGGEGPCEAATRPCTRSARRRSGRWCCPGASWSDTCSSAARRGSGKTRLLEVILSEAIRGPGTVIVIDPKGERRAARAGGRRGAPRGPQVRVLQPGARRPVR